MLRKAGDMAPFSFNGEEPQSADRPCTGLVLQYFSDGSDIQVNVVHLRIGDQWHRLYFEPATVNTTTTTPRISEGRRMGDDERGFYGRLLDCSDDFAILQDAHDVQSLMPSDGGDPCLRTTVYNFEVEDFHICNVGPIGVWVHDQDCDGAVSLRTADGRALRALHIGSPRPCTVCNPARTTNAH